MTSSVGALLIGVGTPAALAQCATDITGNASGCTNSTTLSRINIHSATVAGSINNSGLISPGGISVSNDSTINGAINDSGTLAGGIKIDLSSTISSVTNGVAVSGSTFTGGISNGGTIAAGSNNAIFSSPASNGIIVGGYARTRRVQAIVTSTYPSLSISTFGGGITNNGLITVQGDNSNPRGTNGIVVGGNSTGSGANVTVSTFTGGITNNGTILAVGTGIAVGGNALYGATGSIVTFADGITNNGIISAGGGIGIFVAGVGAGYGSQLASGSYSFGQFSGGISNSGTIFGQVFVGVSTFIGGITNSGTVSGGIQIAGTTTAFSGDIVNTKSAAITAGGVAVAVSASAFLGGITNTGTITSRSSTGIEVFGPTTFSGTITNSGTIDALTHGIAEFGPAGANGISNSGTISVQGGTLAQEAGIYLSTNGTLGGGISNGGTIAGPNGIYFFGPTAVSGGIINTGAILARTSATGYGIYIDGVSSFSGNISNGGTISGNTGILFVGTSTFNGSVTNSGTIAAVVAGISVGFDTTIGSATGSGGISNSGLISISGSSEPYVPAGGILIGGAFDTVISAFFGGIANSGTISAASHGIFVGGLAFSGLYVTISTFSGGITNVGTISAGVNGIFLGGNATGAKSTVTIVSFSGDISNSGLISAGGHGIIIGGTAVSGGSVAVNSFAGNVSNSGTITGKTGIVVGANVSFAAGYGIVNTGNITGTSGAAIDVSAATSPMLIDQNGGTLSGDVKLSANADVLNVNGGALLGSIIGSGSSDTVNFKLGSGSWGGNPNYAITGVNTLNVNSGTIVLDAAVNSATNVAIAGGILQVGDGSHLNATLDSSVIDITGGQLSGHGLVVGGVTVGSGGTVSPGGTIGTMTISGSLTFNSGSIYGIELSPTQHSETDVIGSPGTVTINGGNVVLTPHLGTYTPTTVPILTSTGMLTGTFNPTVTYSGSTTLNDATLSYDPHDVFLSYGSGGGQPPVVTLTLPGNASVNQQNVGSAINNFLLAGGTPPAGFQNLAVLSDGGLLHGLDELSGEVSAGFIGTGFQTNDLFLKLITDPYNFSRGGGFGPAQAFAPDQTTQSPLPGDVALAYASILTKAPPRPEAPAWMPHWTSWGAAYGGSTSIDGERVIGSHDTSAGIYGFAGGMDYRVSPDGVLGFALGGAGTNWSLSEALGSGRSDVFQGAVYASARAGPAYITAALADSMHWVSTLRTITIAGSDTLSAGFNANVAAARLEGGYRLGPAATGVTPYAAVQGQWMHLPSYSESAISGSAQFALTYGGQNPTDFRTELGSWFDTSIAVGSGANLKLYGRAAWVHDTASSASATTLFQSLPGSYFVVNGAQIDADRALLTAGGKYAFSNNWSLQAKFDGEFAGNSTTYAGFATVRYEW